MTAADEVPPPQEPPDDAHDPQPPQDLAAEMSTLGAVLLGGRTAVEAVLAELDLDDFYRPAHEVVFRAVLELYGAESPIDAVTVAAELERVGELRRVGGAPYLHTLIATAPTAVNAGYYAQIVADVAVRRRLLEASQHIHQLATAGSGDDTAEVLERARAAVERITDRYRTGDAGADYADLAVDALARYEEPLPDGFSTGWADLDEYVTLHPGQLIIVAARPGVGKSIVGVNLVRHVARNVGKWALMFSLEMSREEVADRLLACLARVDLNRITEHALTDDDRQRLKSAVAELPDLPIRVEDATDMPLARMEAVARETARRPGGLGLVVVDYLQLATPPDSSVPRQEQVSAMSRGLKLLAKRLATPVVALCQLNRGPEQRADKRPQMSDIRETGSLEQDADGVWLIWPDEEHPGERTLILAKQRQGKSGVDIRLQFAPHYAELRDLYAGAWR